MNHAHRTLVSAILRIKHTLRKTEAIIDGRWAEIRHLERAIAKSKGDRFAAHRRQAWEDQITLIERQTAGVRESRDKVREALVGLIRAYDSTGLGTVNEMAALLSTSTVHVERAIVEGAEGLCPMAGRYSNRPNLN